MGCIHAQPRSIFKNIYTGGGVWKLLEHKLKYDKADGSDSIMMLKVYEIWCKKFHFEYSKCADEEDKRIRKPRIHKNKDEIKW
jgi:hypothetical protein